VVGKHASSPDNLAEEGKDDQVRSLAAVCLHPRWRFYSIPCLSRGSIDFLEAKGEGEL